MVDDAALTAKVKASLTEEDGVNPMSVNVNTYRGVVQLSGFVDSEEAKRRAENPANDVEGVRSVKNDLRAAPRSSSGATKARGAMAGPLRRLAWIAAGAAAAVHRSARRQTIGPADRAR